MPEPQPSFDRFLAAVGRQQPDRVPLGENWADPEVKEEFLGRPVRTLADDVEFWLSAGYDYVPIDVDLYAAASIQQAIGVPLENTAETYAQRRHERQWVGEGTNAIRTPEDAATFAWPTAGEIDCSALEEVAGLLPRGVKAVVTFGHIFTAASQLMGFSSFCTNLYDQPDLVCDVIERLGRETVALTRRILAYPSVGAMWMQDDIAYNSGLLVPPRWLRRIFFPWLAEIASICHAAGRPLLLHSDGNLDMAMEDIIAAGVDALHPIEPKCMDIVAVKRRYGDRLALIGNLDLGYTLTLGTPDEVREAVRYLLKHVAPGGGFLLGSANSVTNYVPLANFKAMVGETLASGRYPIGI